MFGSLRKSWRARLLEIRSSDPQVQRRGRALITIYLVCAGLTLAYLPYILMMPLYEGRRLPYLLVLAVIEAFLAFNIWLSKQGKVDASIVSNCAVMVLGPTILYLGLKIIMSTMWLMVVMPLLCAFAIERKQAILIAAISIGSVMLGRFYLAPYVSPLETLERETIMMLFAAMGIMGQQQYADTGQYHKGGANQGLLNPVPQPFQLVQDDSESQCGANGHRLQYPVGFHMGKAVYRNQAGGRSLGHGPVVASLPRAPILRSGRCGRPGS